jgi:hypothetical protein
MARRSTPERLDAAWHAGVRNRLIGEGMTAATADGWIAAWETRRRRTGSSADKAYWDAGWAWIAAQRKTRRLPE